MKDLEKFDYFLGLEVALGSFSCHIFQAKYAIDLLSRARLANSKIIVTPFKTNAIFNDTDATKKK